MLDNKRVAAEVASEWDQRVAPTPGTLDASPLGSGPQPPSLEDRDSMIAEWAHDPELTYRDIGAAFGLSPNSVSAIVRRAGIHRRSQAKTCRSCGERYLPIAPHYHRMTPFEIPEEIVAAAQRKRDAGASYHEIGKWLLGLGIPYKDVFSAQAAIYKRMHARALSVRDE